MNPDADKYWWPAAPGPEETVRDLLDARAEARADHPALIAPSLLAGGEVTFTYAELRDRAIRMSAVLADAGVQAGDRVGILLDNDGAAEAHVAYHAAHRLGVINVPLNTRYVARELGYVLEFAAPTAVVFSPAFRELLDGLSGSLGSAALVEVGPQLEAALQAADATRAPAPLDPGDDADWIFTSGTTGNPKAVALTHVGSVACGYQSVGMWGLDPTSVYQSYAPFFTSTGCHSNLLACIAAGCTYVVETAFDAHGTLDRMERHRTTSIFLISSVLALMFERRTPAELEAYDFSALRRVCYGGGPASPAFYHRVWEEIGRRWDVELYNIYGLTEGGTSGTMLSHADHPAALERMGAFGLSIGRTGYREWIAHTVLDSDHRPAAVGEVGELCLRGPSTMSRYVDNPEATATALRDGWLHTGDMASVDADGFVYFVDRNKQLIRRGGLNISSAEVEGILLEHPGVLEVAVVPMPNLVLGSDVRAVVVRAQAGADESEAELIAYCAGRLADYKVPARVDFVDALPRNAMNRVMKGALTGEGTALC